jgi:hypothetical protein
VGINPPDDKQQKIIKEKYYNLVEINNGNGKKISVKSLYDLIEKHKGQLEDQDGFVTDNKMIMGILARWFTVYRMDELNRIYTVAHSNNGKFLSYENLCSQWDNVTDNVANNHSLWKL